MNRGLKIGAGQRPEVSIRGAGQEDRSLWGRECPVIGKRCIPESLVTRPAGQGERRLWERDCEQSILKYTFTPAQFNRNNKNPVIGKRCIPESLVTRPAGQGERRLWERD